MKRNFFLFFFVLILLCGCETTKALKEGISKDLKNTWENIKEADEWFKKHAW